MTHITVHRPREIRFAPAGVIFQSGTEPTKSYRWAESPLPIFQSARWPPTGSIPRRVITDWLIPDYFAAQVIIPRLWVVESQPSETFILKVSINTASYSVSGDETSLVPGTLIWDGSVSTNSPDTSFAVGHTLWEPRITVSYSFGGDWNSIAPRGPTGRYMIRMDMYTGSVETQGLVRWTTASVSNDNVTRFSDNISPFDTYSTLEQSLSIVYTIEGGLGEQLGLFGYLRDIRVQQNVDIDTVKTFGEGTTDSQAWKNFWAGRQHPGLQIRAWIKVEDLPTEWKAIEDDIDAQFNQKELVLMRYLEYKTKTTTSYSLSVYEVGWEPIGKKGFAPLTINAWVVEGATAS
jgi:hypothetical protein